VSAVAAEPLHRLVRVGAAAAIVGGGLRIASTFIHYHPDTAWLEALYGVIDVCFLVGLIAVYVSVAGRVGVFGLAGFLVALAGVASIVGPDAIALGVDFYRAGALVFVSGLAVLGVALIRAGAMRVSAWLWIATLGAALAARVAPEAFLVSGVCVGAGFVVAGLNLLRGSRLVQLNPRFGNA